MSTLSRSAPSRKPPASPAGVSEAGGKSLGTIVGIATTTKHDLARHDAVNEAANCETSKSGVLRRFALQSTARALLSSWRVARCLRVPLGGLVSIYRHAEYRCASYGGLQTCGSVHVCPVCSAKICQRRRVEVTAGVTSWSDKAGAIVMATFTLQHDHTDGLAVVAGVLNAAYRKMKKDKRWALFAARYGLVGSITAREYTHGLAGWHPHLHALLFVRGGLGVRAARQLERWLQERWAAVLGQLGRYASAQYGVSCRLADDDGVMAAEYLTKSGKAWTVADELTRANSKRSRVADGRSVVQLLEDAGQGDERAGALFVEYADATFRNNALVWSPGLRALLGLVEQEQTDEEVAAEKLERGQLFVTLDRQQWRVVVGNDARGELLLAAAAGEVAEVVAFLRGLGVELDLDQFAAE